MDQGSWRCCPPSGYAIRWIVGPQTPSLKVGASTALTTPFVEKKLSRLARLPRQQVVFRVALRSDAIAYHKMYCPHRRPEVS